MKELVSEALALGQREKEKLKELEILSKRSKEVLEKLESDRLRLEEESALMTNVLNLTETVKEETQKVAERLFEEVLNSALKRVDLDSDYQARLIHPKTSRSVKGLLVKLIDTKVDKERTPFTSTGTMVAQLLSFLLVAITLKLSGKSKILVVDEVLSGFSDAYSIKEFGEVLVALAENDGFQIILVEHKSQLEQVVGLNVISVEKGDALEVESQYKVEEHSHNEY